MSGPFRPPRDPPKRFGIDHVDFATQERTPGASARFYFDLLASDGAALEDAGT